MVQQRGCTWQDCRAFHKLLEEGSAIGKWIRSEDNIEGQAQIANQREEVAAIKTIDSQVVPGEHASGQCQLRIVYAARVSGGRVRMHAKRDRPRSQMLKASTMPDCRVNSDRGSRWVVA